MATAGPLAVFAARTTRPTCLFTRVLHRCMSSKDARILHGQLCRCMMPNVYLKLQILEDYGFCCRDHSLREATKILVTRAATAV